MKDEVGVTTEDTESTKRGRSRRLQPSSSYPRTVGLGWGWESREYFGKKKRFSRKAAKTPREEGELKLERVS